MGPFLLWVGILQEKKKNFKSKLLNETMAVDWEGMSDSEIDDFDCDASVKGRCIYGL